MFLVSICCVFGQISNFFMFMWNFIYVIIKKKRKLVKSASVNYKNTFKHLF